MTRSLKRWIGSLVLALASIFRFENFWVNHPGFFEVVQSIWNAPCHASSSVSVISKKLKRLRKCLKSWSKKLSRIELLIRKSSAVVSLLDRLEECRPLTSVESNFRGIMKRHIIRLLSHKTEYWRKRCTIRWVIFGDENSRFFHSVATRNHKRNAIPQLRDAAGNLADSHSDKAAILWSVFKSRMGSSFSLSMHFDLSQLFRRSHGLNELCAPFTEEEIDKIVMDMPNDRAPGPDGFNGLFMKKCWHIIKWDYYKLCNDFFNGLIDIKGINSSFITLVPKVHCPETVNDFRPISLLNSCLKLITFRSLSFSSYTPINMVSSKGALFRTA